MVPMKPPPPSSPNGSKRKPVRWLSSDGNGFALNAPRSLPISPVTPARYFTKLEVKSVAVIVSEANWLM